MKKYVIMDSQDLVSTNLGQKENIKYSEYECPIQYAVELDDDGEPKRILGTFGDICCAPEDLTPERALMWVMEELNK